MPALAELYESITAEMQQVCRIFDDELFSELAIVNQLCAHVRQYRGKMLRPALLLLSGRACGGLTPEHLTLAAVVEMVHMATLVHDDVLDEADIRRRYPTINRMEGNEAAILLGDYLISHAFHLCSSLGSQTASRLIAAATNTVCEGELQQVCHRGDQLTFEQYYQIISRKTGALTAVCCRLGGLFAAGGRTGSRDGERTGNGHAAQSDEPSHSASAHRRFGSSEAPDALERYGLHVGIAFQITDDVLDIVGSPREMGKTLGRDFEKRKLTLPLIHACSHADSELRRQARLLCGPFENVQGGKHSPPGASGRRENGSAAYIPSLAQLLDQTGSIAFARSEARSHVDSAICALESLPPSESRDILTRMAQLILDREQ